MTGQLAWFLWSRGSNRQKLTVPALGSANSGSESKAPIAGERGDPVGCARVLKRERWKTSWLGIRMTSRKAWRWLLMMVIVPSSQASEGVGWFLGTT